MNKIYAAVFNSIYKLNSGMSEKIRNLCLLLCCAVLFWFYYFGTYSLVGTDMEVWGTIIVVLMALFSINKKMGSVEWNRPVYYSMVLFGIGVLIISQLHDVGEGFVMLAIDFIFVFPTFYYIWGCRKDHETLFTIISSVLLIFGMISFCYCIYLALNGELIIDGVRVSGYKSNPNYLGMMGVEITAASIFLLLEYIEKKWAVFVSAAGLGIGISYLIISISRTSMLAVAACILSMLIFLIRRKKTGLSYAGIGILQVVAIIIIMSSFIALSMNLNDINNSKIQSNRVETEVEYQAEDANEADAVADRLSSSGKTADSFSSGRISIWKVYFNNLSLTGRPVSEIMENLNGLNETRAHNNFLEYFYRCGYIVGTIYLFFFIAMGLSGLNLLFRKKCFQPKDLFVVMNISTYAIFSMLEISMLPFIRLIACIYFLSIAPIVVKQVSEGEE